MTRRGRFYNGVLLLNKPVGITSHDAVAQVRKAIQQRRAGHTGTLDPRAEGLLVICLGRGTKVARFLTDFNKVYDAEVLLGRKSKTYDSEGIYNDQMPMIVPDMTDQEAQDLLNSYRGKIKQQVPPYSAVKVNGQRLYNLARNEIPVDPPIREVTINDIKLLDYSKPHLRFRVNCSKGTYIRSLANEIGDRLGCGAYLSSLKRLSVGQLSLDDALTLSEVDRYHQNDTLGKHILHYGRVLTFSSITVTDQFKRYVVSGRKLVPDDIIEIEGDFVAGDKIMLKDIRGRVLAVGLAERDVKGFSEPVGEDEIMFSYIRVLN